MVIINDAKRLDLLLLLPRLGAFFAAQTRCLRTEATSSGAARQAAAARSFVVLPCFRGVNRALPAGIYLFSAAPPFLSSPLQHLVRTGKARVVHRAGWGLAPKPGSSSEGGRHATCKHTEVKKPPPWRDGGLLIGKGRGYHHPTGKRFELKFLPTSR